jgi:zinc/manganese transport system substrate-binding protein
MFSVFIHASCQQTEQFSPHKTQQRDTKLKILTTIAPLYCFTTNITGELADVDNLLPSGVGPHEYAFSPSDVKNISNAHILIKNGVDLEVWLDNLIKTARNRKLLVVDTSSSVQTINNDPHIWLSPKNALVQVKNITHALMKVDPQNSDMYEKNAAQYIQNLKILDEEIQREIKSWKKKEFVALHSAFFYFARDYGLKQVAVIQETPAIEPTPKHLIDVISTIKNKGIRAIFSEQQSSPKLIRTIANDLNLDVYNLDTLETGELYAGWYEERMRANLALLKHALQ